MMKAYARLRGQRNQGCQDYRNHTLEECASYYGYQSHCFHDALADARATMFCYQALLKQVQDGKIEEVGHV